MKVLSGNCLYLALGDFSVISDVDIELRQGEMLGLIGPNGSGKTSLLRLLSGLLQPTAGRLTLDGRPLNEIPQQLLGRKIAYLAQNGAVHWPMSVERIVALGRQPHLGTWQQPGEKDEQTIKQVMLQTELNELAGRTFNTLSGGEKARVLLARALAAEPQILLADEPVAALDPAHQLEVMTLLRQHCDQGGACIVVLHDLRLASHYCDRLQLLLKGETLASGSPFQVLTGDHLEQAFGIQISGETSSVAEAFRLNWHRLANEP